MPVTDLIPFNRSAQLQERGRAKAIVKDPEKEVSKLFKVTSHALGYAGLYTLGRRTSFELAPYDFERINKAVETDSYARQAINKYKELILKEGWDITSENDEAKAYVMKRLDYMEYAMDKSFQDFIIEAVDQLVRFNNVFIAKSRGDMRNIFPGYIKPVGDNTDPVIGYYIVPAETVEIQRNRNNKPVAYRQRVDVETTTGMQSMGSSTSGRNTRQPRWKASEMIHLSFDKKPGRAFGTPFLVSTLDDIISLRQVEEDILNLVHKELFPLYKYKVGTPEMPSSPEEVEHAFNELANLRNDGGLVLPERHEVEVIGGENSSLKISEYLEHFVSRVCVGLGLSPHHLGISMNGGNRSVTDRLDIALYDKVKLYQEFLSNMIRLKIFSEILLEGGFNPISNRTEPGISDRCEFRFREIDIDSRIKRENHVVQLWSNDILELEETRDLLGLDVDVNEDRLYSKLIGDKKMEQDLEVAVQTAKATAAARPAPSSSANKKQTANKRTTDNKSRPKNQFGRSSSPNIRRMDTSWAYQIAEMIDEKEEE